MPQRGANERVRQEQMKPTRRCRAAAIGQRRLARLPPWPALPAMAAVFPIRVRPPAPAASSPAPGASLQLRLACGTRPWRMRPGRVEAHGRKRKGR